MGSTETDLSVLVVGDRRMRALNRVWRGKDRPTDVLSFSQREGEGPVTPLLGDVVISADTAARQARAHGHSLRREMERLLIHGVLHLLGHEHEQGGAAARRMRRAELRLERLLAARPPRGRGRAR